MTAAAARLAAVAFAGALALARIAAADPHEDYMLHCQGCHGPGGEGLAGAVPSFRDNVARFVAVPGGREYLVRVPGTSQSELSDARIAALLNWLLHEFSPNQVPADFVPYDEAEVARVRRPPLLNVKAAREELLVRLR